MKDLLIGLGVVLATSALGALVLWAMWHYAVILTPFIRALNHSL